MSGSVANGDLRKVTETLKASEVRFKELTGKIQNANVREIVAKVQTDITQLLQKLGSGEGNLDDVRAFINSAKDKLKQRLTDRIKEFAQDKIQREHSD